MEVDGRERVVKVIDGGAEFDKSKGGKTLLRIRITAEVDGVRSEYTITFSRRGIKNEARGYAVARADAPGGEEADAEKLAAVIKALTGAGPRIRRMKNGAIIIECGKEHLDGFRRYAKLAETIEKWLEAASRRMPPSRAVYTGLSIGQYSESLVTDDETSVGAVQARPQALYQERRPPCGTATSTRSSRPHAVRSRYKPEGDPLGDTDPNVYIVLHTVATCTLK